MLENSGGSWQNAIGGDGISSAAAAVFTSDLSPATLKSLVPRIHGAVFFVYGENGQPTEHPANTMLYGVAHEPKEI